MEKVTKKDFQEIDPRNEETGYSTLVGEISVTVQPRVADTIISFSHNGSNLDRFKTESEDWDEIIDEVNDRLPKYILSEII